MYQSKMSNPFSPLSVFISLLPQMQSEIVVLGNEEHKHSSVGACYTFKLMPPQIYFWFYYKSTCVFFFRHQNFWYFLNSFRQTNFLNSLHNFGCLIFSTTYNIWLFSNTQGAMHFMPKWMCKALQKNVYECVSLMQIDAVIKGYTKLISYLKNMFL